MRREATLLLCILLVLPAAVAGTNPSGFLTFVGGKHPQETFRLGQPVEVHVHVNAGPDGATIHHQIALTRTQPDPFSGTWSDGTSDVVPPYRGYTATFTWDQTVDGGQPVPAGDYDLVVPVDLGGTTKDVRLHADIAWGPNLQVASLTEPGRTTVHHRPFGPYDVGPHAAGVVVLQACVTVTVPPGEEPLNTTAVGLRYLWGDGAGDHVIAEHEVNTTTAPPCDGGGSQDVLVWATPLGLPEGSQGMTHVTAVVDPADHVVESDETDDARSVPMPFAGVGSFP